MFTRLYDMVLRWSGHPKAQHYLAGLSFAESSFFPIPPDVMLAPMVLARPERGWYLAAWTTLFSVLGGVLGYLLGLYAMEYILPLIHEIGYEARYQTVIAWFERWGFWVVFLAGFSPIPYKLFTIASGALQMAFLPFLVASAIGRGARFFLVAGLIRWGGERLEVQLRNQVERIGWAVVVVIGLGIAVYSYR